MARAPIGTTRPGQVLLDALGALIGIGSGLGLIIAPKIFGPIAGALLLAAAVAVRIDTGYLPDRPFLLGILLILSGLAWLALFVRAFALQPARNRALDAYLARRDLIDTAQRAPEENADTSGR